MALVSMVRRGTMLLVVVGISGFAAANPGVVKGFYEDLYPSDPAKRQALELCFAQDHKFNRVDVDQREGCYRRVLSSLGEISAAGAAAEQPTVNLVDLQRAAGAGSVPRNDIRRLEQNQNPPRSPTH
jgi:hypothetical protein